jgi:hypothetical protein
LPVLTLPKLTLNDVMPSEPYGLTSAVATELAEVSKRPLGFAGVPPNR